MSGLEGYMSDLELESKMKDFFNYQPGAAFMKYFMMLWFQMPSLTEYFIIPM